MTKALYPAGATPEPIVMPELPVLDAHIHLWHRDNYFAGDLLADVNAGHKVEASVYVECSMAYSDDPRPEFRPVGETHFVMDQIQWAIGSGHDLAAGILAASDVTLGERVRPVLEAHAEAAKGRLRGTRYRVAWDPDPIAGYGEEGYPSDNVLERPQFLEGVKVLEDMGLVLDVWGFHTQLPEVAKFAAAVPDLKLVVDHVGGPLGVGPYAGKRAEVFEIWRDGLKKIAEVPNTNIKLSGLAISRLGFGFQETGQVSSSDVLVKLWRPYVETCVELFGAERCIFATNYPVDRAAAPYSMLVNAFKKMLSGGSADELGKIFAGNARRIYNLPA